MPRFVYRPDHPQADEFGCVDAAIAGPKFSGDSAAYVISDEMPATRHMANNKMYTSKAKFRQATRDAGCVEVGDQTHILTKPRQRIPLDRGARRDAIRRSIYELKNGIR